MKMKIKFITLILIICTSTISCKNTPNNNLVRGPIAAHAIKDIAITNGIDNKTGKSVPLNPLNGKKIVSCGAVNIEMSAEGYDEASRKKQNQKCRTQVIDPSPELLSAIKLTNSTIKGIIRKDGKNIPATFEITVSALYPGSHCQTQFSTGDQYENCITLEQTCLVLSRLTTSTTPPRSDFNGLCGGFPFWTNP